MNKIRLNCSVLDKNKHYFWHAIVYNIPSPKSKIIPFIFL